MDILDYLNSSPYYYSRPAGTEMANYKTILKEKKHTFSPDDVIYKLDWKKNNRHYECYVEMGEGAFVFNTSVKYYFKVPEKIGSFILYLKNLFLNYTDESCKRELLNYPYVWKFSKNYISDYETWTIWDNCFIISTNCERQSFEAYYGLSHAREYVKEIDCLMAELEYFKFNINNLVVSKPLFDFDDVKVPKWLSKTAFISGVVLVKFAVRSFGQDVDIDISGIDNSDIDVSFDTGDNDYSVDSCDYSSINDGYNVSFLGSDNSDGYIRQGSISLERTISGKSDSFPYYINDGADFVKVNGSYIRIDKGVTVVINGVKYNCI